ncbi:MAG: iron-sulfur cluster repair di-iron protein [Flavobacteriales bacterium]|nr:iron-sulfur cluster repair di-iron protein [Flavobacteriales bacterium]
MEPIIEQRLADLVLDQPATAKVLESYGLDYCCKGGRSLQQACAEKGLDVKEVSEKLETVLRSATPSNAGFRPDQLSMSGLIDHIESVHHAYVKATIPSLLKHTERIALVHGREHPELLDVRDHFAASAGEFTQHMAKEELILFPWIKKTEQALLSGAPRPALPFGTFSNPIAAMEAEHLAEGDRLALIREITNDLTPPAGACTTYRLTFEELKQFEEDLHVHVHLENHLLFPKAIAFDGESK